MASKGKWYHNMIDKYLVEFLSSDWKSAKSCVEFIISEGNTNVPNANAMSSYPHVVFSGSQPQKYAMAGSRYNSIGSSSCKYVLT